jgi:uncharacterized iron-regulated membrane protein
VAGAPRPRRARAWLKLWHRWFGLAAGLWLLPLALTGSAIVFYEELDRWLNPDLRMIETPLTGRPQVGRATAAAQAALPGFAPRFVDLPDDPHGTIVMIGTLPGTDGTRQPIQAFADPRDGRLLGWRTSGVLAFDRRHLMDTLYSLHMDLMLGETMAWFLGLVALLWILDHAPAAMLAIPRLSRWRTAFKVQGRNLRLLFDLHRAPGTWLFPVTLTLAISGVSLAWHEEVRAVLGAVTPISHRLHEDWPAAGVENDIGIDRAIERAPGSVRSVVVLSRQGAYAVRSADRRDFDDMARLWTYVRMADGAIVGARHDNGQGVGDVVLALQYPLHSGKAFGLAGRLAIVVAGLGVATLCATGLFLFLRRAMQKRTAR